MSTADNNTNQPKQCLTPGCTFTGSESFQDMCSICYKNKLAAEQDKVKVVDEKDQGNDNTDDKMEIENDAEMKSSTTEVKQEEAAEEIKPKKVQKNKKRCLECKKKVGLLGIECHCGFVFCGTHRYPDQHNCDFDFKKAGKEDLEKNNTKAAFEKVEKL